MIPAAKTKVRQAVREDAARVARERETEGRTFLNQLEAYLEWMDGREFEEDEDEAQRLELEVLKDAYRQGVTTPARASAAAQRLLRADSDYERARAEAQTIERRAKRRRDRCYDALYGSLMAWADQQERKGKTVRMPGTTVRITYRANKGKVTIDDAAQVLEWLHADVGLAVALERGLLRVKKEPSRSGLLAWVEETGDLPRGASFEPPRDKPTLYRK